MRLQRKRRYRSQCRHNPKCDDVDGFQRTVSSLYIDPSQVRISLTKACWNRDASRRYTAWVPYNGSRALWPETHPYRGYEQGLYEELYEENQFNMSDYDGFE